MTPRERILVMTAELRDLQQVARRGYLLISPERLARIIAALEAGADACERADSLASVVARLKAL